MVKVYDLNRYKIYKLAQKELDRKIRQYREIDGYIVAFTALQQINHFKVKIESLRDSAIVFSDE